MGRRSRRRSVALAAGLALLAAAGGCGGDDEGGDAPRGCSAEQPSSDAWTGAPEVDPDTGEVAVAPFNRFLREAPAPVGTSPCDAARVFLQLDRPQEDGVSVEIDVEPEDAAEATAMVTLENLPDDSVDATRWRLDFVEREDGGIRLASARVDHRCQPGRGQQGFAPDLCL